MNYSQITGSAWMCFFLLITALLYMNQIRINKDIWTDQFKFRYKKTKIEQGLFALMCSVISLVIWFTERSQLSDSAKGLTFRISAGLEIAFLGLLLNKILHGSRFLATVQRLKRAPAAFKDKEFCLLNLPGWRIPKLTVSKNNLEEVTTATSKAVRCIEICWLIIFTIIIPTLEFAVATGEFNLIITPFRIL